MPLIHGPADSIAAVYLEGELRGHHLEGWGDYVLYE